MAGYQVVVTLRYPTATSVEEAVTWADLALRDRDNNLEFEVQDGDGTVVATRTSEDVGR